MSMKYRTARHKTAFLGKKEKFWNSQGYMFWSKNFSKGKPFWFYWTNVDIIKSLEKKMLIKM